MRDPMARLACRRGFSLVEMAIVMGVIGSIIALIFSVAGPIQENARIADAMNRLNMVSQNMTSMLQGNYNPGLAAGTPITQAMITSGAIPSWMVTAGTVPPNQTADNPWSLTNFIMFWMSSAPPTYRIKFQNVGTMQGCVSLITQATNCTAGQPGCPISVFTDINPASAVNLTTTLLTSTEVQTLCAANSYTGGNNSVEFDFTS